MSLARTLARHQAASLVATAADFGAMMLLVELAHLRPALATLGGATFGALVNFTMGRLWVFGARGDAVASQGARYAIVSGGSALLNAAGEQLLAGFLRVPYVAARVVVAIAVSVAWNFPLQKFFVFRATARTA